LAERTEQGIQNIGPRTEILLSTRNFSGCQGILHVEQGKSGDTGKTANTGYPRNKAVWSHTTTKQEQCKTATRIHK